MAPSSANETRKCRDCGRDVKESVRYGPNGVYFVDYVCSAGHVEVDEEGGA